MSQFYEKHKVLPLPGSVPDMKAQSKDYIELQNVYKSKARRDVNEVVQLVRQLETSLNADKSIDEKEIEAFCKNAAHIKLIRGKPLQVPTSKGAVTWGAGAQNAAFSLTDETSLILLYIAFIAYDIFHATHSVAPGLKDSKSDKAELISNAKELVADLLKEVSHTLDDEDRQSVDKRVSDFASEL
jgi:amyloid beta precursor protein binding protein 1